MLFLVQCEDCGCSPCDCNTRESKPRRKPLSDDKIAQGDGERPDLEAAADMLLAVG